MDGLVMGEEKEVGLRSCFEGEAHASHTPATLGSTGKFAWTMTYGWRFLFYQGNPISSFFEIIP